MNLRRGSGFSYIHVQIVNPAVINELTGFVEDGGFGRGVGVSEAHQRMLWIEDGCTWKSILADRRANVLRGLGWVGKDEPELNGVLLKLTRDTLQLWSIALGNRAVATSKKENADLSGGRKRINRLVREIAHSCKLGRGGNKSKRKRR